MIAESLSEGLLDPEEHTPADPGAADPQPGRQRRRRSRSARSARCLRPPTERCRPSRRSSRRSPRPGIPGSRSPTPTAIHRIPAHQGRAAAGRRSRRRRGPVDGATAAPRRCDRAAARRTVPAAPHQQPSGARHGRRGPGYGDGRARGPGRGPGGDGARRHAPCLSRSCSASGVDAPASNGTSNASTRSSRRTSARPAAAKPHPVCDFLFTYYSLRPRQLRRWHPGYGVVLAGPRRELPRSPRLRHVAGHRRSHPRVPVGPASTPSQFMARCCAPPRPGPPG